MHIFVINLPEATARREAIERQLRGLGLEYEIFPAIRGNALSAEAKVLNYDDTWFNRNQGRSANAGELGCALSHLAVYRMIIDQDISHALILEDDAWLNPNLPKLLQAIEQKYSPDQANVFLLSWTTAVSTNNVVTLWASYRVARVRSAVCTHGYVVSNAAASALIKALFPVRHAADSFTWLRRHRIVNLLAIIPNCITLDLSYETSITSHIPVQGAKRTVITRLAHKVYRAWWRGVDHGFALMRRFGIIA